MILMGPFQFRVFCDSEWQKPWVISSQNTSSCKKAAASFTIPLHYFVLNTSSLLLHLWSMWIWQASQSLSCHCRWGDASSVLSVSPEHIAMLFSKATHTRAGVSGRWVHKLGPSPIWLDGRGHTTAHVPPSRCVSLVAYLRWEMISLWILGNIESLTE